MSTGSTPIGELLPQQKDVPRCFACGPDNPTGLRLRFKKDSATSVSTVFSAPRDWTGWGNILHGGFQALLLDEVTAWVPFGLFNERAFVTKEMAIRYLKPATVEQPLTIVGQLVKDEGRAIVARGEIRNQEGTVLTESLCTMVRLKPGAIQEGSVPLVPGTSGRSTSGRSFELADAHQVIKRRQRHDPLSRSTSGSRP